MPMNATDAQDTLRQAWDEMITALQAARDAIDQPELMPPPPTDRNLQRATSYLMGFVAQRDLMVITAAARVSR